ncbi:hypothetical protein M0R72_06805 [Candidatus Pacearchaeota archaeon]|jgi:hypothetical protein|nr:hypothetical protein [Candidatus Pacearchaeota archaeon]
MSLVNAPGRAGNLKVSGADTSVLGVRNLKIDPAWSTEKLMHLQDTAPSALLNFKEWTVTFDLTEDLADAGQDLIRTAFDDGTSLAFKGYVDATHYWTSTAVVTKYSINVDPNKSNTASVTFEPYMGTAITNSL